MPTDKQLTANRLNAQKSTGPRTIAGKAASSMNALKTGIDAQSNLIKFEEPQALAALTAEYYTRFHPLTPEQRDLVDTLISTTWLLRRIRRAETQLWNHQIAWVESRDYRDQENPLGEAATIGHESFARLQRRLDCLDRTFHRALRELQRLQSESQPDPPAQPVAAEAISPEIGFVPPSSDEPSIPPIAAQSRPPQIGFVTLPGPSAPPASKQRFETSVNW